MLASWLRKGGGRRTWSAVMPFMSAFLTLSRVIEPTTRFGKRYFKDTNRFKTAVCKGLSVKDEKWDGSQKGSITQKEWGTCVGVHSVISFQNNETLLWAGASARGSGKRWRRRSQGGWKTSRTKTPWWGLDGDIKHSEWPNKKSTTIPFVARWGHSPAGLPAWLSECRSGSR